jgi:hypothetical protein
MVEKKRGKSKKAAKRELKERRFEPLQTQQTLASAGVGMIGCLVLGAGVYGQWVQDEPLAFAPQLLAVGAVGLGAALWLGNTGIYPVRVGDAGIAIERGADVSRVAWYDLKSLRFDRKDLIVEGSTTTLKIPTAAHPKAAALAVLEAERRVPKAVKVSDTDRKALPTVGDREGTAVAADDVQVAGNRCAASDTLISFERDARLCPNCGQSYHRDHVPKQCITCDIALTGRALSV